jgi:hypothetical protein
MASETQNRFLRRVGLAVALLACLAFSAAFASMNLRPLDGLMIGGMWHMDTSFAIGWPLEYASGWRNEQVSPSASTALTRNVTESYKYLDAHAAIANVTICAILVSSPLWLWRIRGRRQRGFSVRDLLLITTAVAIALGVNEFERGYSFQLWPRDRQGAQYSPLFMRDEWERIPALCAIATCAAAAMCTVGPTTGWLARRWPRHRALSGSPQL